MGAMMMYVLPMLLGQTYDLGKHRPGLQIFPANVSDSAVPSGRVVAYRASTPQIRVLFQRSTQPYIPAAMGR
ncbi:hypothetical protein TNCV_3865121 [Trichonephila clavipes]|nr:hypothetical protein TNCV_3865121 [Trichonephila clavipes]